MERNDIAVEAMKIFLHNQAKYRRITLLNRIKSWLDMPFKAAIDINTGEIVKTSYNIADAMLEAAEPK